MKYQLINAETLKPFDGDEGIYDLIRTEVQIEVLEFNAIDGSPSVSREPVKMILFVKAKVNDDREKDMNALVADMLAVDPGRSLWTNRIRLIKAIRNADLAARRYDIGGLKDYKDYVDSYLTRKNYF